MLLSLIELDQQVFEFINSGMSNIFFDWIMPVLRNKYVWIPFYVFLISYLVYKFEKKRFLFFMVFLTLSITITDQLSSSYVKNYVKRIRPCNQIEIPVIERVSCGSGYSFTSSHAANHFGLALFLIFTLGFLKRKHRIGLVLWAFLISFAQVYVGVHYPMDVIVGALVGGLIGIIMAEVFNLCYENLIVS